MTAIRTVNFSAFEPVSGAHGISAAVVIPPGLTQIVTSGHVGIDTVGKLADTLEGQMTVAFENVERSLLAACPGLSAAEAWNSIYQITTYHVGGVGEEAMSTMGKVGQGFLKEHRPAWTAVGVETLVYGRFEIAVFAAVKLS